MRYSLAVTVEPAAEPLTLTEVKEALRIDGTDEDTLLTRLIKTARRLVEAQTGITIVSTTYRLRIEGFRGYSGAIELPRTPVTSVSSVIYTDSVGDSTTLDAADYTVSLGDVMKPARIVPAYLGYWPQTRGHIDDVAVTFVAGSASAAAAPPELRDMVWMLVDYMHRRPTSREDSGLTEAMERAWGFLMPTVSRPVLA